MTKVQCTGIWRPNPTHTWRSHTAAKIPCSTLGPNATHQRESAPCSGLHNLIWVQTSLDNLRQQLPRHKQSDCIIESSHSPRAVATCRRLRKRRDAGILWSEQLAATPTSLVLTKIMCHNVSEYSFTGVNKHPFYFQLWLRTQIFCKWQSARQRY